jgi:phosphomannomutase
MAGIFKAYDIRGIYGKDLTAEIAYKIGRAFVTFAGCKKVAVARDIRPHSEPLFAALAKGITEQGADVIDLGYGSTPMSYFANGTLKADGSVMITASHNPAEWNGFKLCRAQAVPISGATGILDIEKIVNEGSFAPKAKVAGKVTAYDILPEYARHVTQFAHLKRPVHVAIDFANGMGIWEVQTLKGLITWDGLFETPDGTFPNHEANPLHAATLKDLQTLVRKGTYAFGVAYDGDADRAGFVDEKGEIIPMDLITALVAQDVLATRKGVIFYDLRSSRVVKEVIEAAGGIPMMCRVGHAFIKQQMREHNALFAGELSGHYYFKDNFTAESSAMAILSLANIVSKSDKPLSALIAPLRKYFASGEINTRVSRDPQAILAEIRSTYSDGHLFELDGVSVEYKDFWFNVRCSNTEPLVRLNLEAKTQAVMEAKRDEVLAIIRK